MGESVERDRSNYMMNKTLTLTERSLQIHLLNIRLRAFPSFSSPLSECAFKGDKS